MSLDNGIFPVYDWIDFAGASDGAFPLGPGALIPPPLTPLIAINPSILTFRATITREDPQTQVVAITNSGIGTLDTISVSESADWLTVWTSGSGNTQYVVNRVDIGNLAIGTYTATITITSSNASNSPQTYLVVLIIDAHADATPLAPSIIIWVSIQGDDSIGTGSQVNPYRTIERALQDFDDGDQIRILDGVYTPADTVIIDGLTGSIFAENPGGVTIQPQHTTKYSAGIAVVNSARFTVQGIHIKQSTETASVANTIGLYANNVQNFVMNTCTVSDFNCTSDCMGIAVSGTGRIDHCIVEDMTVTNSDLYGIHVDGLYVLDCIVRRFINRGGSKTIGIG